MEPNRRFDQQPGIRDVVARNINRQVITTLRSDEENGDQRNDPKDEIDIHLVVPRNSNLDASNFAVTMRDSQITIEVIVDGRFIDNSGTHGDQIPSVKIHNPPTPPHHNLPEFLKDLLKRINITVSVSHQ